MTPFEWGLRRADDVIQRSPLEVEFWLVRAMRGRSRWRTRLFHWRKRQFLDGFVSGLEKYLEEVQRDRAADEAAPAIEHGSGVRVGWTSGHDDNVARRDPAPVPSLPSSGASVAGTGPEFPMGSVSRRRRMPRREAPRQAGRVT
jgi:hypothetical protein